MFAVKPQLRYMTASGFLCGKPVGVVVNVQGYVGDGSTFSDYGMLDFT